MSKANSNKLNTTQDEMLPEYDFSGKKGVRGKYYQAYRKGHTVKIREADGTVTLQYFTLQDGAVMLEPDVQAYFPDSDAVNTALRSLIALAPAKRKVRTRPHNSDAGRTK
jgi:hypothetical protein